MLLTRAQYKPTKAIKLGRPMQGTTLHRITQQNAPQAPNTASQQPDKLQRITESYPAVQRLINKLQLEALHDSDPGSLPSEAARLEATAWQCLQPEQAYTSDQATQAIATRLNINSTRAAAGLAKMIETGALQKTGSGTLYLATSTPF